MNPRPSNASTISVPAPAIVVKGLDVSHWQPVVNWPQVAKSCGFAILKASEGIHTKDQMFRAHYQNAKAAGLIVGSYHFFHPELSPTMQAQNYLSMISPFPKGDLPPVIDFEEHGGIGRGLQVTDALVFMSMIEAACKVKPIIYLSPSFMTELGSPQEFFRYPLWIANYGVTAPHVPPPWNSWTFWQNSESGVMAGANHVDTDMFYGSMDDLKKFVS